MEYTNPFFIFSLLSIEKQLYTWFNRGQVRATELPAVRTILIIFYSTLRKIFNGL